MGLLNQDQWSALGLVGQGLLSRNPAAGFGAAMQHLDGAKSREMEQQYMQAKLGLLGAQVEETKAQALERQQKMELARKAQEQQSQLLYGNGPASAGAFTPGPGGMGPVAPQGEGGGLVSYARQLGIPEQAIQADVMFNGGKKISELLAERAKPNWQNINGNLVNTNAQGFKGGFQPGMSVSSDGKAVAWQPDEQGGLTFGAPRGALETYGAYQNAGERARADFDPVQVVGPNGANYHVPRSQVVGQSRPQGAAPRPMPGASSPADGDRFAIFTQERARAVAAGRTADVEALDREIARLPAGSQQQQGPAGLAVAGGFQATPTTAQVAEAAAAKVRAEADARAASDRQAGKTKKSDASSEMLSQIERAKTLLSYNPTGSPIGYVADKAMALGGFTTDSSNNAAALETLSGWLTMNTPRMEGPQSNYDQELYKTMAGKVGDRTVPVKERQAALAEVERIQRKYAATAETSQASEQPKANVVSSLPKTAPKGTRARDTATGEILVFNGMSWVKAK
jgi:hypothetical protein